MVGIIQVLIFIFKEQNKYAILLAGLILFSIVYFPINRWQLFKPRRIPLTWLDHKIKLTPWTIWIYLSIYPVLTGYFLSLENADDIHKTAYAFLFLIVFSGLIFFFFPTTYFKRHDYNNWNQQHIISKASAVG